MNRTLYGLCGADHRPFSPHVWKTMLSLAHKGLEYNKQFVGFTQIPSIENGATALVPVLRDGNELIRDSFDIALYLEEAYPDRPSLFGGEGGKAMARFIESWSQLTLHSAIVRIVLVDIHDQLAPVDQTFFRSTREPRFGMSLEAVAETGIEELKTFAAKLEPLRAMLKKQPFIGGETPLFSDYIVFGPLQWARVVSQTRLLEPGDPVLDWFERCLDLHNSAGRSVTAA